VPLREIVEGELVAVLTTVTLPERLPAEVGANVTLKEADCPAARLRGRVSPLVLYPAPLALICEMETLELPVFEIVTLLAAVEPVARLPKLRDVGVVESWSVVEAPVPASGITSDEFGALLMNVMLPEKLAAEDGVKPTANEVDPPGGSESGIASPEEVKPLPAREAWVTVRVAVPGFRMVTDWVAVAATLILPKLTLDGLTDIWGCTPAPLNEMLVGELVAVLTTLMVPTTATVVAGAKLAVRGRLWPAARVTPPEKPVTLNPPPMEVTCEILTLPVPVFLSVKACDTELPTRILPKFRLLTLEESKYDWVAVEDVPVPET
jgi:hypothetical protein